MTTSTPPQSAPQPPPPEGPFDAGPYGVPVAPKPMAPPAHPYGALTPPGGKLKGQAARDACLAVPYLGPEPPPSRTAGRAMLGIVGVILVLRLLIAALLIEQSQRLREMADGTRRPGTLAALDRSDNALVVLTLAHLALAVAAGICWLAWRAMRRPKDVVQRQGEAYVESPLRWVRGTANRWWLGVCIGAGVIANSLAAAATPSYPLRPTAAELATSRSWAAASSLLFAGAWISWGLVVRRSEALLAERLELSPDHRAGLVATPHFLAVPKADSNSSWEQSEGIGWVLRTAGLVLLIMVSVLGAIGGIAGLADGDVAGAPFLLVGAAGCALAVRIVLGRRTRRHEAAAAAAGAAAF